MVLYVVGVRSQFNKISFLIFFHYLRGLTCVLLLLEISPLSLYPIPYSQYSNVPCSNTSTASITLSLTCNTRMYRDSRSNSITLSYPLLAILECTALEHRYGFDFGRPARNIWLMNELSIPFDLVNEAIPFEVADKNPNNKVPFLHDRKTKTDMFESLAINVWIVQNCKELTTSYPSELLPQNAHDMGIFLKYVFLSWIKFSTTTTTTQMVLLGNDRVRHATL